MRVRRVSSHYERQTSRRQEFLRLREELLRMREVLRSQAGARPALSVSQDMPADVLDVAAYEHDQEVEDLIRQRATTRLGQINMALNRMLEASYGLCQGCGTEIPIERLRVQPEATRCIACRGYVEARTLLKPELSQRTSDRALRDN